MEAEKEAYGEKFANADTAVCPVCGADVVFFRPPSYALWSLSVGDAVTEHESSNFGFDFEDVDMTKREAYIEHCWNGTASQNGEIRPNGHAVEVRLVRSTYLLTH